MPVFVCSDLHLGEPLGARMFHDNAQGLRFAELCELVARTGGELVLLGDIFDLTAAMPPRRGLDAFARSVGAPGIVARDPRPIAEVMAQIREANPRALEALESLAAEAPVTLVPGNHDRHLGEPGGREALDAAGLSGVRIEATAVRRIGEHVAVLQHGHAWDPSNATPTGGGEVMTGVLYHAVIPYLRSLVARANVSIEPDRVALLRPEERVVPVLERWLPQGRFEIFLDAFLELLVENGYLSRALAWLATPLRIRERLKTDDDLWERSGRSALAALEGKVALAGNPPPADVLVLGHTHVIDWAVQEGRPRPDARTGKPLPVQRLYVNLGSWTARASDAAGPLDAILPVLELEEAPRALHARLRDLAGRSRTLQTFEVPR
jgi:UDP-2,3-diacylglucosamine pyrophosphatase LpxH